MNCKYVETDSQGNVTYVEEDHISPIPALSTEIAPKGCARFEQAFIIDLYKIAICDGNNNWYTSGGKSIPAGKTWAELFA